jgi:hypothetical protein
MCGAERSFTNEQHPFGQPSSGRRLPPGRGAAQRGERGATVEPLSSMTAFLLQHRTQLGDAILQE